MIQSLAFRLHDAMSQEIIEKWKAELDLPLGPRACLSASVTPSPAGIPAGEPSSAYHFVVRCRQDSGAPSEAAKAGTKLARGANFRCVMSGTPIEVDYIKAEGKAGRMGARRMAIVAEGERGRVYLPPTPEHRAAAKTAKPEWEPEGSFVEDARAFTPFIYGLGEWQKPFTNWQGSGGVSEPGREQDCGQRQCARLVEGKHGSADPPVHPERNSDGVGFRGAKLILKRDGRSLGYTLQHCESIGSVAGCQRWERSPCRRAAAEYP